MLKNCLYAVAWTFLCTAAGMGEDRPSVVAPGAKLVKVGDGFKFTEGPASDAHGSVFFSDIPANRTYKWSPGGKVEVFRENTAAANGQAFDRSGNLLACEGGGGRVVSVDPHGKVSVVVDRYQGKRFNQPNDLWIDPKGGFYFTDPIYGNTEKSQDGEHVYYVSPDRKCVIRVIDDMVRPNGVVGTPDGKTLYVTDHGAKKTYVYRIAPDATLTDKRLFAPVGADGMKLDSEGNLYLTEKGVLVYDASGKFRQRIETPLEPANLCFTGADRKTLFITARTEIYTLQMAVAGSADEHR